MKDVENSPFLRQFELVSLFAYRVYHLKMTKELGFQLAIPLSFEVFAIQPNLITRCIASGLDSFIIAPFLKLLCMV